MCNNLKTGTAKTSQRNTRNSNARMLNESELSGSWLYMYTASKAASNARRRDSQLLHSPRHKFVLFWSTTPHLFSAIAGARHSASAIERVVVSCRTLQSIALSAQTHPLTAFNLTQKL